MLPFEYTCFTIKLSQSFGAYHLIKHNLSLFWPGCNVTVCNIPSQFKYWYVCDVSL